MAPELQLGQESQAAPWSTLRELASLVDPRGWVLIGGLMVEVHVRAAGVLRNRATADVDVVIDLASDRVTAGTIAGALYAARFTLDERYRHAYRFRRGSEVIDVLIPGGMSARLRQRPMLTAQAGRQALDRREEWTLAGHEGPAFVVGVPSVLGALILKGAAFVVDTRDNDRHLQDATALLSTSPIVSAMRLDELSGQDRVRLRKFADPLSDSSHSAWLDVDPGQRAAGQLALARIKVAAAI